MSQEHLHAAIQLPHVLPPHVLDLLRDVLDVGFVEPPGAQELGVRLRPPVEVLFVAVHLAVLLTVAGRGSGRRRLHRRGLYAAGGGRAMLAAGCSSRSRTISSRIVHVTVNDEPRALPDGMTVADLVATLDLG